MENYTLADYNRRTDVPCRICKAATKRVSRICDRCRQKGRIQDLCEDARIDGLQPTLNRLGDIRVYPTRRWWGSRDGLIDECFTDAMRARCKKYGLPFHEWFYLVAQQRGACAICQRPTHPLALNIDHDHTSGRVRGLLCTPCNTGLGALGVDGERKAIDRAHAILAYVSRKP